MKKSTLRFVVAEGALLVVSVALGGIAGGWRGALLATLGFTALILAAFIIVSLAEFAAEKWGED